MLFMDSDAENLYNEKILYLNRYYNYSNSDINRLLAEKIEKADITLFEADERETFVSVLEKLQHVLDINIEDFIVSYTNCMFSLSDVKGLIELANLYPEEYATFFDKHGKGIANLILEAINDDVGNVESTEDDIKGLMDELEDVRDFFDVEMKSVFTYLKEKLEDVDNDESDHSNHRLVNTREETFDQKIEDLKIDNMFSSLLR
ncbi:hypothetical protein [Paenibacillus sp. YN15]|uniref:hypothetical protein n=1 Tax=Paenibacillus sp. YN15 TaxID=1742774 RepID=UPI000DCB28D4|nr:hypothetical protein [Paenibacillus sp. YN15]RAU90861.1 hypothetical protein DQG13_30180 [Paenibacillus sp. YN15]